MPLPNLLAILVVIYLGSIVLSVPVICIFNKYVVNKLKKEGYTYKEKESFDYELKKAPFPVLIPVYFAFGPGGNILVTVTTLLFGKKMYENRKENMITEGIIIHKPSVITEPAVDLIKKVTHNVSNVEPTITIDDYKEMNNSVESFNTKSIKEDMSDNFKTTYPSTEIDEGVKMKLNLNPNKYNREKDN